MLALLSQDLRSVVLAAVLLLLCAPSLHTTAEASDADSAQVRRPRIGLALSGGGARGLAHIGVLKVLEELRIPVDCVAGTSMGSIVGGLYALGLSPTEIESAVLAIDWRDLFTDKPHREERSFRRKQDDRSDLLDFEMGVRTGQLTLPRSLIAGQKLAFAFKVPALHTAGHASFDELPIPFRAVATDIQSGRMVILDKGSLVRALRASMSVPGVFPPVEIDGKLLVDGGIARNLPIDVVEDMGADVIIAVDAAEQLSDRNREELSSLLGLSLQLVDLTMRMSTDRFLPQADIVVQPQFGALSIIDFDQGPIAIRSGELSARKSEDDLHRYSLSETEYEEFRRRHRRVPQFKARITEITLTNHSRVDERAIRRRLSVQTDVPLQLDRLQEDLLCIYDLGSLDLVDFELDNPGENTTLRLLLQEKSYGPNLFNFGVNLSSDLQGKTRFNARGRLTRMEMNSLGAEWRNDFRFGTAKEVNSEWYQPVEFARRWFVAPQLRYLDDFKNLYDGEDRIAEYKNQNTQARLDVGRQLARFGELRTGLFFGYVRTRVESGNAELDELDERQGGWLSQFAYDLVDDPDFPKHGGGGRLTLRLSRKSLGSESRYDKLSAHWGQFHSWADNTTFLILDAGSSLGTVLPAHEEFLLGGLNSFSGFNDGQLRGRVFATARLGTYRPITGEIDLLGTQLYGGVWVEAGNIWQSNDAVRIDDLHYPWTLALGVNTLLGPVYLAYGRVETGEDSVFLTVGRQIGVQP